MTLNRSPFQIMCLITVLLFLVGCNGADIEPALETPTVPPTPDATATPEPTLVAPMPLISRGVPVTASSEIWPARYAVDADYESAWRGAAESSITVDLEESMPLGIVMMAWYGDLFNGEYDYSLIDRPAYNLPREYQISISENSQDWSTLVTVSDNTLHSRQHKIDMTGNRYLRLEITAVNGSPGNEDVALNLDIHDATNGADDNFIFYGDSITTGSMIHQNPVFSELVQARAPDHFPLQESGGMSGWTMWEATTHIPDWLELFEGRYVGIAFGTNDASQGVAATEYRAQIESVVYAVIAAGKVPVIPRIPYSTVQEMQSSISLLNREIDDLIAIRDEVLAGPDLYEFFSTRPHLLSEDGVHPTHDGYIAMRQLWANFVVDEIYEGTGTSDAD